MTPLEILTTAGRWFDKHADRTECDSPEMCAFQRLMQAGVGHDKARQDALRLLQDGDSITGRDRSVSEVRTAFKQAIEREAASE